MSEMVERVARALERNSGIRSAPNWWLKQARSAIEAMLKHIEEEVSNDSDA